MINLQTLLVEVGCLGTDSQDLLMNHGIVLVGAGCMIPSHIRSDEVMFNVYLTLLSSFF